MLITQTSIMKVRDGNHNMSELTQNEKDIAIASLNEALPQPAPVDGEYSQVEKYSHGDCMVGIDTSKYNGISGYVRFVECYSVDGELWRYDDVHTNDGRSSGWYSQEIV